MPSHKTSTPDPLLTPDQIHAIDQLSRSEAVWIGGRRPAPDGSEKADACFWIDIEANEVRGFDIVPRGTRRNALLQLLVDAMLAPHDGLRPQRPHAVASDDARLNTFLAPVDIEVRNAPKALVDQMFDAMLDLLEEGEGLSGGYLSREDVHPQTVGRFFEAAAQLFKRAPWKHMREHELVRIEGLKRQPLFVSVDGSEGDEPAIAIFERETDARALLDNGAEDLHADDLPPHLVLCFEAGGVDDIVDEAREHGWAMAAGHAVPVLMRSNDGDRPLAGETDLALAAAVIALLAQHAPRSREPVEAVAGKTRLVWPHDGRLDPG